MALLKLDPPPTTWPRVHDRSYYPSTIQSRPLLRRFPRVPRPGKHAPSPLALLVWGDWHVNQVRAYTRLIMSWWSAGAPPMGKPWWEALAAAIPLITYPGALKTLTGKQWFLWFQRKSLCAEGWNWFPFYPTPTYTHAINGGESLPYPNYPRLPWSPPAAPTIDSIFATLPNTVTFWYDAAPPATYYALNTYFARNPLPKLSARAPLHEANQVFTPTVPPPWPLLGNDLDLASTGFSARPGHAARVGLGWFDLASEQPSDVTWADFAFA